MANLSTLPAELVLRIARSLRSFDSVIGRAENLKSQYTFYEDNLDWEEQLDEIKDFGSEEEDHASEWRYSTQQKVTSFEQASLFSLSASCRRFRSLLLSETHYFISSASLKRRRSLDQLRALLALLERRPDIRSQVQQMHLCMDPSPREFDFATYEIYQPLWERIEAKCGREVKESLGVYFTRKDVRALDTHISALLLAMLLPSLSNVRGLSIFTHSRMITIMKRYIRQYPALLIPEWDGDSRPKEIPEILPNLESFALLSPMYEHYSEESDELWRLPEHDASQPATFQIPGRTLNLSELWLAGFEDSVPPFIIDGYAYGNVTSLTLNDIDAPKELVKGFVRSFQNLQVFKYFAMEECDETGPEQVLSLGDVVKMLRPHAKSLKMLCYNTELDGRTRWDVFENFVSLEDLWVTSRSFVGKKKKKIVDDDALEKLPSSLKRLHIAGDMRALLCAVSQLVTRRDNGGMPNLEEVAFDVTKFDGRTEVFSMEILEDFKDCGVRAFDEADEMPGLW